MSFAFIPRKLGKKALTTSIPAPPAGNSKGKAAAVNLPAAPSTSTVPAPRADEELAEEFAILVVLSLTEYALWTNADLRRQMEETPEDEHGFVPLRYILKHSPLLQEQQHYSQHIKSKLPSESVIVKAIRKHAEYNIEVRMVLSGPTWTNWGSSSAGTDEGMYEIRSNTKVSQGLEGAEGYMRNYWANRTIYIENIPPAHRTVHGIFQFVRDTYPSTNYPSIQRISFPPHYLDTDTDTSSFHQIPKSRPKCKGFAFVVFSSVGEVDQFSAMWKWERARSGPVPIKADTSHSLVSRTSSASSDVEARKYGFRALPKAQWDALKDEYVAWRQQLLEQVLAEQDDDVDEEMKYEVVSQWGEEEEYNEFGNGENSHSIQSNVPQTSSISSANLPLTSSSPFPPNCLVFIRNIHAGTNKTTLRTLLSKALINGVEKGIENTQPQDISQCIDYVDYTKGMDTCYIRFSSPSQASALQSYLTRHCIVQNTALDDTGIEVGKAQTDKPKYVEVEVVQGKKEEIYWEKVPIKVRQEAVWKAISNANATSSSAVVSSALQTPKTTLPTERPTSVSSVSLLAPSPSPHPHSPSYPRNCLVFVRNVHPGTNKTTVRALFVNALSGKVGSSISAGGEDRDSKNAIDYVDYTKGTDSCHLRLRSPSDAHFLVEHFKKQFIVQNAPLDDGGVEIGGDGANEGDLISSSQRCIIVELVQGTREKIYWEKVPLKLRQDAVRRANTSTCDLPEPFTVPHIASSTAAHPATLELKTKPNSKSSKKRNLACADVSVEETGAGKRDGNSDDGERVLLTEYTSRKKKRKKI
ncbi:hypothetical protein C8J55DRAFT_547634 [Lentinula edodes]|uniref:XRRM domain-containing protein n=1 Tax=Lentinula lateritia TaxID=40482 RepID=A0A9W9DWH6_9AGAR|nr:hypothetical protein C8J55DRAFT_547634 [Lentinula edodes]